MQVNQKQAIDLLFQPMTKGTSELQQTGGGFAAQFKDSVESLQKERLADQQQALILQAQKLLQNMDIVKLRQYRDKLSEFFEELTQQAYSFHEERFTDQCGHSKYYSTVQTVNEELADLLELAKNAEKNRLEILSKIDSINGLVLNIVV